MSAQFPGSNPLNYLGTRATNPPQQWEYNRAPTEFDWEIYAIGDEWLDKSATPAVWYKLVSKAKPPSGNPLARGVWKQITHEGGYDLSGLTGDNGTEVFPNASNTIQLQGTPGQISVTEDAANNKLLFALTATGTPVTQIDVDANSAPGTDPTLPTATGLLTLTGSQVSSGTVGANVLRSNSLAANAITYQIQQSGSAAAQDTTLNGVSHFDNTHFTVTNGFVQLIGGSPAIDSVAVQTSSPPGTNPVLPNGTGQITINGTAVAAQSIPLQSNSIAANTLQLEIQRTSSAASTDTISQGIASFDNTHFSVDANGFVQLIGGGTAVDSFTVPSGTSPVVPNSSGVINLPAGNGFSFTGGTNAMTGNMVSPFTGDFAFTKSTPGSEEKIVIAHSDNTAANNSGAALDISIGGSTQIGDPYVAFITGTSRSYALGSDTTDSQILKINTNNSSTISPSAGTNIWQMDSSGRRLLPLQTVFQAYLDTAVTNVTGDNTIYTIIFDTEFGDVGSVYNTSTGEFTAPITGKYHVSCCAQMENISATHTAGSLFININGATSYTLVCNTFNIGAGKDDANRIGFTGSETLFLTSGDIVTIQVQAKNSTKTVGVGGNIGGTIATSFSAFLMG